MEFGMTPMSDEEFNVRMVVLSELRANKVISKKKFRKAKERLEDEKKFVTEVSEVETVGKPQ